MKARSLPIRRALGAWASPVVLMSAFVFAIVLITASTLIDLRNDRALAASNRSVSTTIEALEKIRQTGNLLFIAESSQRGYVITGKDLYLAPYQEMHRNLFKRLDEVANLISDIPAQRDALSRLRTLAIQKFAEMDHVIEVYRDEGQQKAIAAISSDEGLTSMATMRQVIGEMLATEGRLLGERREQASAAYMHGQIASFSSSVVIALALTAFYLLMHRYLKERDAVQKQLEAANAALERRVRERTTELSQLSRHLLNVREGEKQTIARDLHDEFGSYLTAINMDVSRVRDKIARTDPDQAARLERTLGLLNHAIEMKRRLISDLRPSILDNLGLGAALDQYIDDWSRYTGISTTFKFSGDLDTTEEGCPIAIFRVFQEALNNVAKHSGASEVVANIHRDGNQIVFEIADNGSGITEEARSKPGAHGLLGIRERVLAYNGKLEFLPAPKGGTILRATLDCRVPAKDDAASLALNDIA